MLYKVWGIGWCSEKLTILFRAPPVSLIKNGLGITYHSVLHSPEVCLEGSSLNKVKSDSAFVSRQNDLISKIKSDSRYCKERFSGRNKFSIQFGGRRARGDMWSQALGFWKPQYRATWEMAMNELTWTVRSTIVHHKYEVSNSGQITIDYSFTDILDLRPNWSGRSIEYNAICSVLGFLYHDVLGNSDELKVRAYWTKRI